jgi:hypothetical protein
VFPHVGPSDYTVVVESSPIHVPLTGGDILYAAEAGLKLFDYVGFAISDDGTYLVQPIPASRSDDQVGAPTSSYILRWVVVSTGAEVAVHTFLADQVVRLFALGPK